MKFYHFPAVQVNLSLCRTKVLIFNLFRSKNTKKGQNPLHRKGFADYRYDLL